MLDPLASGEPSPARVEVYTRLATLLFLSGQYGDQLTAAECAVNLASDLRGHPLHPEAMFYRGLAFCLLSRLDAGIVDLAAGARMAESMGDLRGLCELLGGLGIMQLLWGTPQESRS